MQINTLLSKGFDWSVDSIELITDMIPPNGIKSSHMVLGVVTKLVGTYLGDMTIILN
jgi:hypothetical protein